MKAQTMATFQKSSSRSDESAYTAKMLSGLDRGEFRIVLKDLIERNFDPIVQFANKLSEALSRLFETIAREFNALVQKIEAAPEIPSYEKLLIEKTGYGPLLAKFMAHQICHWGRSLAAKINEGRKVRTNIDKIADAGGGSTLVMSRLAKKFRDQCRSVEVQNLIESAIKKANLPLTAVEFDRLVERACERDENACRNLGRLSQQLAPHLPEKRGRPISAETCTHLILLWWLESSGHKCAYTSSPDNAGFTDPVTRATQLASGNGGFSPLYAHRLHKRNFLPPGHCSRTD
ncbi:MAG TPA: hypothetical protein VIF02_02915 [Methylocella sp.]